MNEEQIVTLIFFGLVIILTILKPFFRKESTFNFLFKAVNFGFKFFLWLTILIIISIVLGIYFQK
jgi:hypothetical protein